MSGRSLFQLADGWALGADDNQWMLLRARKRHAETVWQPVSFIASTKTILLLCMAKNGIQVTADAQAQLDELPERFLDIRAAMQNTAMTRSVA
jgi:hypothetical protein